MSDDEKMSDEEAKERILATEKHIELALRHLEDAIGRRILACSLNHMEITKVEERHPRYIQRVEIRVLQDAAMFEWG